MKALNLPQYPFQIRNTGQITEIFDSLRKKYVILTPEEWVRQHFIMYLREQLKYPAGLISVERGLSVNTRKKRADITVASPEGKPWMVVECKAPGVKLSQDAFYQAATYHVKLNIEFLVVTNGMNHYCCRFVNGQFEFRNDFPTYPTVSII